MLLTSYYDDVSEKDTVNTKSQSKHDKIDSTLDNKNNNKHISVFSKEDIDNELLFDNDNDNLYNIDPDANTIVNDFSNTSNLI